jgi:hypothetical protein
MKPGDDPTARVYVAGHGTASLSSPRFASSPRSTSSSTIGATSSLGYAGVLDRILAQRIHRRPAVLRTLLRFVLTLQLRDARRTATDGGAHLLRRALRTHLTRLSARLRPLRASAFGTRARSRRLWTATVASTLTLTQSWTSSSTGTGRLGPYRPRRSFISSAFPFPFVVPVSCAACNGGYACYCGAVRDLRAMIAIAAGRSRRMFTPFSSFLAPGRRPVVARVRQAHNPLWQQRRLARSS